MNCPRCASLMLPRWLQDDDNPQQIRMLTCPCCSYQTDEVTERNRKDPESIRRREYLRQAPQ